MGAAMSLITAIGLPLSGGMAVGMLTRDEIKGWYKGLKKPKWNPPNWVFGPAWAIFYASMGAASWVTARKGVNRVTPLVLYFVQLGLNFAWTPLFFKAHKLDLALADSTAMLGIATAATVTMSRSTDKPAVILPLMVPYLAWVTFATALTGEILRLNPDERVDWEALGRRALDTKDQAAAKVQEGAKAVQTTAAQVANKAGEAASEVARKAREDAHDLGQIVKEAVGGEKDEGSKPMTS